VNSNFTTCRIIRTKAHQKAWLICRSTSSRLVGHDTVTGAWWVMGRKHRKRGLKQAGVPHREAFQRMNYLYQVSSACEICVIEKKGFTCHKPCKPLSVNIHQIHVEFKVWILGCVSIVMRSQDGSGYTKQTQERVWGKTLPKSVWSAGMLLLVL